MPSSRDIGGAALRRISLVDADYAHLLHPQHHPSDHTDPQIWVSGDGATITNLEGRTFIDGLSGMWNVNVGHGRRELVEAATKQLSTLAFATAYAGSSTIPAIELAQKLSQIVYPNIEAFYFTSGGGDATDTSLRTARFFWRAQGRPEKSKIIARELSYHGSTVAASSATGVSEFSEVFGPRLPGFLHIASPYPYRFEIPAGAAPGVTPGVAAANLLEQAILREGPETVAAFIAEPIQGGGGGVIVPQDDYFPRIREICDRYEVLLISDDVITGFGRSGRWFGLEHWRVQPDIVQFAKGITSGYIPLGGIGVSGRIKRVLDEAPSAQRWWHGYTYSGHPVAAAVALATIKVIEDEDLVARSAEQGDRLRALLHGIDRRSPTSARSAASASWWGSSSSRTEPRRGAVRRRRPRPVAPQGRVREARPGHSRARQRHLPRPAADRLGVADRSDSGNRLRVRHGRPRLDPPSARYRSHR